MSSKREAFNPDDEVPPVSPAARSLRIAAGLLLLLAIVAALVWFVANNTERDQGPLQADPPELSRLGPDPVPSRG